MNTMTIAEKQKFATVHLTTHGGKDRPQPKAAPLADLLNSIFREGQRPATLGEAEIFFSFNEMVYDTPFDLVVIVPMEGAYDLYTATANHNDGELETTYIGRFEDNAKISTRFACIVHR